MIIWIIGIAGSGKSTISKVIYEKLKKNDKATVLLDGDQVRDIFSNDIGHSREDRLKNAKRIRNLCKLFDVQKINAVCSILSISEKDRNWCRKNLSNYKEIYIKDDIKVINKRGVRKLYSDYDKGVISNVVGKDIKFEEPIEPDFIIHNNGSKSELIKKSYDILKFII